MDVARIYFLTMTQWYIVVAVSRVHNADILLDLASSMFFPLHFSCHGLVSAPLNPPRHPRPPTLPPPAIPHLLRAPVDCSVLPASVLLLKGLPQGTSTPLVCLLVRGRHCGGASFPQVERRRQ